jgi:hypothetical protein
MAPEELQIGKVYRLVTALPPAVNVGAVIQVTHQFDQSGHRVYAKVLFHPTVEWKYGWNTENGDVYEELSDEEGIIYKMTK